MRSSARAELHSTVQVPSFWAIDRLVQRRTPSKPAGSRRTSATWSWAYPKVIEGRDLCQIRPSKQQEGNWRRATSPEWIMWTRYRERRPVDAPRPRCSERPAREQTRDLRWYAPCAPRGWRAKCRGHRGRSLYWSEAG